MALILVVLWAIFTNKTEKFLGGLTWQYPHVFNWHPIMMVAGMVVCMTEGSWLSSPHRDPVHSSYVGTWGAGLLAFRAFPFDKLINRRVRYIWHTAGIAMMCTGLAAVLMYHNDRNQANLWSLHSWLGVMTITLYLSQYVLGWYIFFNESADTDMREAYIPFFAWLDIFMFVAACFTVVSLSPWRDRRAVSGPLTVCSAPTELPGRDGNRAKERATRMYLQRHGDQGLQCQRPCNLLHRSAQRELTHNPGQPQPV